MRQQITIKLFATAIIVMALVSCEGDHTVVETDWTTLESVELQHQYNKFMEGDWEYVYEDSLRFTEIYYTFSAKDSVLTGYYNEAICTKLSPDGVPDHNEWTLMWQGEFTAKWVLLYSVELEHPYLYLGDIRYKNVHGMLSHYDVMSGRVLFYHADKSSLTVTTPLSFRKIVMHHRSKD